MKTGASDDSRKTVLIHIGSDGDAQRPLHERIQIDDSNPEDIVIQIMECESLRIDFNQSPESGREWNADAFLKIRQPEDESPIPLVLADYSSRISSELVPLARVRWSSIPPSPELLSRQNRHSGAGAATRLQRETVEEIHVESESESFREQQPHDDVLQIVRASSYPPPGNAENAWRRRPIFWVSAAAMLVLAWVVGFFIMMSPVDVENQQSPLTYFQENAPDFTGGDDADLNGESMLPLKTETAGIAVVPATSESALFPTHRMHDSYREASNQTVEAPESQRSESQRSESQRSEPAQKEALQKTPNVDWAGSTSTPIEEDAPQTTMQHRNREKVVKAQASSNPNYETPVVPEPSADMKKEVVEKSQKPQSEAASAVSDDAVEVAVGRASGGMTDAAADNAGGKVIADKPATPTRDSVKEAMTEIAPYIRHCRLTTSGRVVLEMVVTGASGQIVSARAVDDTFKGTATGLCAARVVKSATLPVFQKDQITIIYPFDL